MGTCVKDYFVGAALELMDGGFISRMSTLGDPPSNFELAHLQDIEMALIVDLHIQGPRGDETFGQRETGTPLPTPDVP